MQKQTNQNPLGDDALAFRPAFQAARGGISRSKQHRDEKDGLIPPPDAYVGRRPAWKISTIRETVEKLVAVGGAAKVDCAAHMNSKRLRGAA